MLPLQRRSSPEKPPKRASATLRVYETVMALGAWGGGRKSCPQSCPLSPASLLLACPLLVTELSSPGNLLRRWSYTAFTLCPWARWGKLPGTKHSSPLPPELSGAGVRPEWAGQGRAEI